MSSASQSKSPNPGVHRADPVFRRQAMIWLAAAIVMGLLAIWLLPGWLTELRADQLEGNPDRVTQLLRVVFTSITILLVVPMVFCARLAKRGADRIDESGCYPTPEMKTVRNVEIRRDSAAHNIARLHRISGILLLVMSACLICWSVWIWQI